VSNTVSFTQEQGIATLIFDNPARRNALGTAELDAIEAALGTLSAEARVLVITSSDESIFCAGADLRELREGTLSGDRFQSVTNQIAALPVPTVAVLNGNVFGGGAELALSCDYRLAREGMILRIPAAAIGLCYPVVGIERLTRRLGPLLARRVLVAAETFTAEQMLSLRMIDAIHSAAALPDAAQEFAESLLALAPMAVTNMLEIIRQLEAGDLNRSHAESLARACSDSEDVKEGIAAQREKRSPQFQNR
jgi:enoyl-CoA hydratase/carnithine racemase